MSELRDIAGRPAGIAPRKLEPVENLPSPIFRTKGLPRESCGSNNPLVPASSQDIAALFATREGDRYAMHASHLNEQMVRVLRTIGYDVGFCRGSGQYPVSYTHLRAHETVLDLVCRLLLEKKKK